MMSAEPTAQTEELSERVRGIIGGYQMGAALNAQDLFTKTVPGTPPPDPVPPARPSRAVRAGQTRRPRV
jgi:hypothetical protein